jgi:hypothetical protein
MVEYAVLVAHNSANVMNLIRSDVLSLTSRLDLSMLWYVAAGLVFLRVVFGFMKPTSRY